MNTPFEKLLSALKIASPHSSLEEKAKELMKQYIKNHNYIPFHENNLIAIVDNANDANRMLAELEGYTKAFNLDL